MKYFIPVGFAACGSFLISLPLVSQIVAFNTIANSANLVSDAAIRPLLFTPYMHLWMPWLAGIALIAVAIKIALKSYRE